MKAVIVDICGRKAAALTRDGQVVRINDAGYALGQSIELAPEKSRTGMGRMKKIGLLAAASAAAFLIIFGAAFITPYGTVMVSADSSIKYTINCFNRVLDIQAEDENSKALLAEMDISGLKYRKITEVVAEVSEEIGTVNDADTAEPVQIDVSSEKADAEHMEKLRQELESIVKPERQSSPAQEEPQETAPAGEPVQQDAAKQDMPQQDAEPQPEPSPAEEMKETPGSPEHTPGSGESENSSPFQPENNGVQPSAQEQP